MIASKVRLALRAVQDERINGAGRGELDRRREARAAEAHDAAVPDTGADLIRAGIGQRRKTKLLPASVCPDDDECLLAAALRRLSDDARHFARDACKDVGRDGAVRACDALAALHLCTLLHAGKSGAPQRLRKRDVHFPGRGKLFKRLSARKLFPAMRVDARKQAFALDRFQVTPPGGSERL